MATIPAAVVFTFLVFLFRFVIYQLKVSKIVIVGLLIVVSKAPFHHVLPVSPRLLQHITVRSGAIVDTFVVTITVVVPSAVCPCVVSIFVAVSILWITGNMGHIIT